MENTTIKLTPNGFVKTLSIIHLALLSGLIIFLIIAYTQNKEWLLNINDTSDVFFFIAPILAVGGILAGNFLYDKQIDALSTKNSLREKLTGFQTASIMKYALIEGPALLAIVSSMNSGNLFYIIIAVALIVYFFFQKPTKEKIESHLKLNSELKMQFNNADQAID